MNPFRWPILIFLVFVSGALLAQEQSFIPKKAIRDSVADLLTNYRDGLTGILPDVSPDPTRRVMEVFANPNVQVTNNLSQDSVHESISIRSYCAYIKSHFPDGLGMEYVSREFKMGPIEQDYGNRYVVGVRTKISIKAYYSNEFVDNIQDLTISVGFSWENDEATQFTINGITLVEVKLIEFGVMSAVGLGQITADWVSADNRFFHPYRPNYAVQAITRYWIKPNIAIQAGIGINTFSDELGLDQFNALDGRDPNFQNIRFATDMYQMSGNLGLQYHGKISNRMTYFVGLAGSYRHFIWIDHSSAANNLNRQLPLTYVYSDPLELSRIRMFDINAMLDLGISLQISNSFKIDWNIGVSQGLVPLDLSEDTQFQARRYLGQYNPLWMDPGGRNYFRNFQTGVTLYVGLNGKR